jgi:pyrroline-5-carboxylate reductase
MKATIIGAGNMGSAIGRGFAAGSVLAAGDITFVDNSAAALARLAGEGFALTADLREAMREADLVIVAVKPHIVGEVMARVRELFDAGRQTLLSVAAGVALDDLDEMMFGAAVAAGGRGYARFRVMPNTAVAVGESMTFFAHRGASASRVELVGRLLGETGRAVEIPERQMEAAMAVASCGIAYAMRYVRAAMNGAIEVGLAPALAREAVLQTLRGAVELLAASGLHPEAEIDRVTTPGGYTIRGLNAMEAAGFSAAVVEGIKASYSHEI